MRCDIIIPIWNQPEVTRECLDSIFKHTGYPYRLILIDNASSKPTAEYLDSVKARPGADILLIRNDKNLGFVKAVNQGIAASDAPFLCIMNNDTIATSGWLNEMIEVMDGNPETGLLNPSSNTSGQFPAAGETVEGYAESLKPLKGTVQELYTCRGFCMLLRRPALKTLGPLDEIYQLGYFDDADYSRRAQREGYRIARAKAAYVYHKENKSFKAMRDNNELFKKNERIFFDRWGRPVRVAYLVSGPNFKDKVNDISIDVARSGHQITVFLKSGVSWPVELDHFDIRRLMVSPVLFCAISAYKIWERRKKKRFEIILTDSKSTGYFLSAVKDLLKADIVVNPDKETVSKLLKEKSRQF